MQFLNPLMLWGALAVGIPIALHFWHQKKGKLVHWAATQWLTEKDLQPAKGIRLDNILLLIIRCLLILLLAFLLAKPILHWPKSDAEYQKIHLVQENTLLINNYKFELEEALKKGEKVYQIGNEAKPVVTISAPLSSVALHPLTLQTCLNKVYDLNREKGNQKFELYLINSQEMGQVANIVVPTQYSLHSLTDTTQKLFKPYLEFSNKSNVYVNAANQLTSAESLPADQKFENQPVHSGAIHVLIETKNKEEKQLLNAGLKALTDVYKIVFSIDEAINPEKHYDWVFAERRLSTDPKVFSAKTLFMALNENEISPNPEWQTLRLNDELRTNGQLPEWLGQQLVNQFQLNPSQKPLSNQQFTALFTPSVSAAHSGISAAEQAQVSKVIFLVFILLLGIERWLSIRKNA